MLAPSPLFGEDFFMLYQSTRSRHTVNSLQAILEGIAPDGGLYLPVDLGSLRVLPQDLEGKSFEEMAAIILRTLFSADM